MVGAPYLELVLLNANEHVDSVENLDGGGVHAREVLFADLAEDAADRVEAVRDEVVRVVGRLLVLAGVGAILVLVDVRAEGLLVLRRQLVEVGLLLQVFHHGDFDVCKCKEFFYTHWQRS